MSTGVLQAEEVTDLVTSVQCLAARLDPDRLPDAEVPGVLTDLGQVKRLVDGMVALMARRSIDVNLADGTVDGLAVSRAAREQVAAATGSTPAEAKRLLDTSVRLRDQPEVADAVREGRLSGVQAEVVSDAAAAAPDQTGELLTAAARQTVSDLKRTCRDTRVAADPDPAATCRRHHATRGFRSWHESDGEWKALLSGPADAGARIEALIRRDHDQLFKAAHADRRVESDAALRFDALLQVLETGTAGTEPTPDAAGHTADDVGALATRRTGHGRGRGRQTQVIVRVDATALKRGRASTDETCEIAGVGRVSVDAVRELIPHAHITYVIADAVDASVVHLGRQVTAHQRTALLARGYECEVPDCRSSHLLEIDHVRDWATSRQTRLDQLAWLCRRHHKDKTRGTHQLHGPPGNRRWVPTGRPPGAPATRQAPAGTRPVTSRTRNTSAVPVGAPQRHPEPRHPGRRDAEPYAPEPHHPHPHAPEPHHLHKHALEPHHPHQRAPDQPDAHPDDARSFPPGPPGPCERDTAPPPRDLVEVLRAAAPPANEVGTDLSTSVRGIRVCASIDRAATGDRRLRQQAIARASWAPPLPR
jgi:hypothetical protein